MPPKNVELGDGRIYFSIAGEKTQYMFDEFTTLEFTGFEETVESPPICRPADMEFECVGTLMFSASKFLYRIMGRSNNWLKMHGYPMVRGRFLK